MMSKRQIERVINKNGAVILAVIQEGTPVLPLYLASEDGTKTTTNIDEAHQFSSLPEEIDAAKHFAFPAGWKPGLRLQNRNRGPKSGSI